MGGEVVELWLFPLTYQLLEWAWHAGGSWLHPITGLEVGAVLMHTHELQGTVSHVIVQLLTMPNVQRSP